MKVNNSECLNKTHMTYCTEIKIAETRSHNWRQNGRLDNSATVELCQFSQENHYTGMSWHLFVLCIEVRCQVSLVFESLATLFTLVRTFIRMPEHVSLETAQVFTPFTAYLAYTTVSVTMVTHYVTGLSTGRRKIFPTILTVVLGVTWAPLYGWTRVYTISIRFHGNPWWPTLLVCPKWPYTRKKWEFSVSLNPMQRYVTPSQLGDLLCWNVTKHGPRLWSLFRNQLHTENVLQWFAIVTSIMLCSE